MHKYKWKITVTGSDSREIETEGEVIGLTFDAALENARIASLKQIFERPGTGCGGPYRIIYLALTLVKRS